MGRGLRRREQGTDILIFYIFSDSGSASDLTQLGFKSQQTLSLLVEVGFWDLTWVWNSKTSLGFQQPAEKVSIQSTDWRQNDGGSNKSRTLKRKPRRFMLKKHPTCHPFCLLLHLQNEMVVFFRFVTSCHGKPVDSERKAELSSSWWIVWCLPCRSQKTWQASILKDLFNLT